MNYPWARGELIEIEPGSKTPALKDIYGEAPVLDVYIAKSKIANAGRGVFASRTIAKGETIVGGEFGGIYLHVDDYNPKTQFHVRQLGPRAKHILIDGLHGSEAVGLGAIINCPRQGLRKNVEHFRFRLPSGAIVLSTRATRKIEKDAELLVTYGWSAARWREIDAYHLNDKNRNA